MFPFFSNMFQEIWPYKTLSNATFFETWYLRNHIWLNSNEKLMYMYLWKKSICYTHWIEINWQFCIQNRTNETNFEQKIEIWNIKIAPRYAKNNFHLIGFKSKTLSEFLPMVQRKFYNYSFLRFSLKFHIPLSSKIQIW